jgi:hypothetical protein
VLTPRNDGPSPGVDEVERRRARDDDDHREQPQMTPRFWTVFQNAFLTSLPVYPALAAR